jgi:ABC-type transporter Mla subunit MlaD
MVALAAAIAFKIAPGSYFWTMFFMTMPGSFLSALLANMNNRQSVSQSRSPVSSSGAVVGQVTSIQFARNVVVSTMKSEDTNSPIDIEMKAPTESGAYAV